MTHNNRPMSVEMNPIIDVRAKSRIREIPPPKFGPNAAFL
jgi:hypothetical protein